MTRPLERALRALARFDLATSGEVAAALGCGRRTVWAYLQALVQDGLATRQGENNIKFAITDAGRAAIAKTKAVA